MFDAAVTIINDHGGNVAAYVMRAERISPRGIQIKGICDSACTMYITVPNVCLHPSASFGFHLPFNRSGKNNSAAHTYMMGRYPAWVRRWIAANGGLNNSIKRMNYAYASRYVRTCK